VKNFRVFGWFYPACVAARGSTANDSTAALRDGQRAARSNKLAAKSAIEN
jgi:hypothetical protein